MARKPNAAARKRSQASKKGWETRRVKAFRDGFKNGFGSGEIPSVKFVDGAQYKLPARAVIASALEKAVSPPKPTLWQRLTGYLSGLRNVG